MEVAIQEQACWLLLAFKSRLPTHIINDIIDVWCRQLGRTLQEFFAASSQEWSVACNLDTAMTQKLEQTKEQLVGQALLVEQLAHDHIHLLTLLDDNYPKLLRSTLKRNQRPVVLCYAGDLQILERPTIAIIGSRNAGKASLTFTREVAQYLATQGVNVISGNARGVDRAAYEGAISTDGCTTVVLPQGIRKLSSTQMRNLLSTIAAGKALLLSQFHPDTPWLVSRAMERNKVVTALAQVVIVAESNTYGGTWAGANGALEQRRPVYVREAPLIWGSQSDQVTPVSIPTTPLLAGNEALIERGGRPLIWPTSWDPQGVPLRADVLSPLIEESDSLHERLSYTTTLSSQLSLLLYELTCTYAHL